MKVLDGSSSKWLGYISVGLCVVRQTRKGRVVLKSYVTGEKYITDKWCNYSDILGVQRQFYSSSEEE